ncbi:hypothetical protein [Streptomyces collinus]|uniref:hypothetical protein n=1 Tax=Streptomyces collinus TaxID=42684 RepID=UPI0036A95C3C
MPERPPCLEGAARYCACPVPECTPALQERVDELSARRDAMLMAQPAVRARHDPSDPHGAAAGPDPEQGL